MPDHNSAGLSRRERQIIDILYQKGQASALDVMEALADPPGYSAVRTLLRILETKGHVRHVKQGARFIYMPVIERQSAAARAIRQVVNTFFGGSAEKAVISLLSDEELKVSEAEMDRLMQVINQANARESEQTK
jgi:BlaI family penicillinase repressor